MSRIFLTGIMPALITPFDEGGRIKRGTVEALVESHLAAGVSGFYVCGGTGEGALLTADQRKNMAEAVVKANAGRGKVMIQVGSIHGREALELARHAAEIGADGVSSVLPSLYFNYCMEDILRYYRDLAGQTDLPLLIYASNTGGNIDINILIQELLKIKNVIGLKDTRANYYAMWKLRQLNHGDVNIINGPDESLLAGLVNGADGGIGATYNVMPGWFVSLYRAFIRGNLSEAQAWQLKINRVIQLLLKWYPSNIVSIVKEVLRLQGYDAGSAVYPAQDLPANQVPVFRKELEELGILLKN